MWHLSKIMFLGSLILGTVMAISSYSWMGMWMGLEINLLSFIPLIKSNKNALSAEAALKYFITQAIASSILLFSLIMLSMSLIYLISINNILMMVLNSALLLKLGAAPFHFWFPEVMEGLSWTTSILLLTWQKIAPLVLLIYSSKSLSFMISIVISCMVISGILGQNQISLRKIMAYSSINHIGWMIAALLFAESTWLIYFLVYSIITINIVIMFNTLNISFLKQIFPFMKSSPTLKLSFFLNFLSLGGLPPFLGFLPKWLTIQILMEKSFSLLALIMIIFTLLTLFFYLRVCFSTLALSMNHIPMNFHYTENKFLLHFLNLISLSSLIMITLFFNYF